MASTIKVYEGQSLLDICVQHCGSISALFEIMHLNNLEDLTLVPGTDLLIPDVINQQVVDYLNNLRSSTQPAEYSTGGAASTTATVNVKNSLLDIIATGVFSIGASGDIIIDDTVLTVNGSSFINVPSSDSLNIEVVDSSNFPITPLIAANKLIIPTPTPTVIQSAPLMKTGQTTSYRDGDDGNTTRGRAISFFVLGQNNYFGNNQRFTGVTGGYFDQNLLAFFDFEGNPTTYDLAFPNWLVCDWSTMDSDGNFNMWYRGADGLGGTGFTPYSHDDAFDYCAALSIGGFTDWNLPNVLEMYGLVNHENIIYWVFPIHNGYMPFWTSTYFHLDPTQAVFVYPYAQTVSYNTRSFQIYTMPIRLTNISEL